LKLWPILPAETKKIRGKKRYEPAIIILFVKPPIVAQSAAEPEPEKAEREGEE